MALVVFYEKPGCINNRKQKALLAGAGHQIDARNLLTEAWTPERLRAYLGEQPVARWINSSHPQIKSGALALDYDDPQAVLAQLCADPLLIRRPLMEIGGQYLQGFDADRVDQLIGLSQRPEEDIETCPRTHSATSCSSGGA